jgi:hypothetical protein
MGSLENAVAAETLSSDTVPDALHIVSPLLFSSFLSRKSGQ